MALATKTIGKQVAVKPAALAVRVTEVELGGRARSLYYEIEGQVNEFKSKRAALQLSIDTELVRLRSLYQELMGAQVDLAPGTEEHAQLLAWLDRIWQLLERKF